MWPTVRRAVDWVLGLRAPRGRDQLGARRRRSAGKLRAAVRLLEHPPEPALRDRAGQAGRRPQARLGARGGPARPPGGRAPGGVRGQEPVRHGLVLPGARRRGPRRRRGRAARGGLGHGSWCPGLGVRCVSDQPWVTGAETCELVIALDACGMRAEAAEMFADAQHLRHPDGSYWTGWQFANRGALPAGAVQLDRGRGGAGGRRADRLQPRRGIFRDVFRPHCSAGRLPG
jgi:hypothetical protein